VQPSILFYNVKTRKKTILGGPGIVKWGKSVKKRKGKRLIAQVSKALGMLASDWTEEILRIVLPKSVGSRSVVTFVCSYTKTHMYCGSVIIS